MKNCRKIFCALLIISLVFVVTDLGVMNVKAETITNEDYNEANSTILKVDTAKSLDLKPNTSYTKSFKMTSFFGKPHNAFTVKIGNAKSGNCRVIITSSSGFSFTSPYITAKTYMVSNCNTKDTYTVKIIAGPNGFKGDVSITSFTK